MTTDFDATQDVRHLNRNGTERALEAEACFKLSARGWSLRRIGSELGLSKDTVSRRIQEALDERLTPLVQRHREMALHRLDLATEVAFSVIDTLPVDHNDKIAALRVVVSIETRRAALLGLDQPIRTDVHLTTAEAQEEALRGLVDSAKADLLREQAAQARTAIEGG